MNEDLNDLHGPSVITEIPAHPWHYASMSDRVLKDPTFKLIKVEEEVYESGLCTLLITWTKEGSPVYTSPVVHYYIQDKPNA